MLIRFNVKNFLSFFEKQDGKSQEFSMIAGKVRNKKEHLYDDGKIKLLKLAAVYGANASGKSNVVKALNFMKQTIISGLPEGHSEKYCKTNKSNKNKESYFEIEIKIGEKYYVYGFEIILSQSKFVTEWLIEVGSDGGKEKILFNRDIKNGFYEFGQDFIKSEIKKKLDVYAEDIKEDSGVLFLKIMNQNKKSLYEQDNSAKALQLVYLWIRDKLEINYPERPISDYSYMAKTENVKDVCRMISAFGTGITDFKMVDVPIEKVLESVPNQIRKDIWSNIEKSIVEISRLKNNKGKKVNSNRNFMMRSNRDFFILSIDKYENLTCKTIKFIHESPGTLFDMSEESDGTVRILDLLEVLLSREDKTYVIDELDRCLHPSLTYKFIDVFLELATQKNIQLIVTTHESRLLDFELLRRDEIWFINKKSTGESDIYSLEEYNARFDKKIDKAYLDGRYGGIPIFNTVFPIGKEVE